MSQAKKSGYSFYRTKAFFIARKKAQTKKRTVVIEVIDNEKILLSGPVGLFTPSLKQELRGLGGVFSPTDKGWLIPRKSLNDLRRVLSKQSDLKISDLPKFVYKILQPFPGFIAFKSNDKLVKIQYNNTDKTVRSYNEILSLNEKKKQISDLPENFQKKLYSFQKKGVRFGIKNFGRILLGDEMGVGKTAQALALASLYKNDWPFVVFVPSSLRYVWKEEILNWLEDIKPEEVQVITKSNQEIAEETKALVISYDLGCKMVDEIEGRFNFAIADEAYYLKNSLAKRTEYLLPLLQKSKRCLLLAGTPALARPKEIFNLLHILRPDVFTDFREFGRRYCNPSENKVSRSLNYNGASSLKELHYVLTSSVMIRRLKKDVLAELPTKIRQKIPVDTDHEYVKLLKEVLKGKGGRSNPSDKLTAILRRLMKSQQVNDDEDFEEKVNDYERKEEITAPEIFECYRYTGLAKLEGIKKYIKEVAQQEDIKFLVFGHHTEVLDGIEEEVTSQGLRYIRIDGKVPAHKRYELVQSFQTDEDVKVGILSLTTGGLGLTLTAASTVIFAEMYWTPAIMLQAEDRIHRIGQREKVCVNYYYLYGKDTLDTVLYKILQRKIAIVSEILEGQKEYLDLDQKYENVIKGSQKEKKVMEVEEAEEEKNETAKDNFEDEPPEEFLELPEAENEEEDQTSEEETVIETFTSRLPEKNQKDKEKESKEKQKSKLQKKIEAKDNEKQQVWEALIDEQVEGEQEEKEDEFWDDIDWVEIENVLKEDRKLKGQDNASENDEMIVEQEDEEMEKTSWRDLIAYKDNKNAKKMSANSMSNLSSQNKGRVYIRAPEDEDENDQVPAIKQTNIFINQENENKKYSSISKNNDNSNLIEIDDEADFGLGSLSSFSQQESDKRVYIRKPDSPKVKSLAQIISQKKNEQAISQRQKKGLDRSNNIEQKVAPFKNKFGEIAKEISSFRKNMRTLSEEDFLLAELNGDIEDDQKIKQDQTLPQPSSISTSGNKSKDIKRSDLKSQEAKRKSLYEVIDEDGDDPFFGIAKKKK